MTADATRFQTLMQDVLAGCPEAKDRFCRLYQDHILRIVRYRLQPRLRTRFDSMDFVHDVWVSFFAQPPRDRVFADASALIAYLEQMARFKVGETARRLLALRKHAILREIPLDPEESPASPRLAARTPSPSQELVAKERWQQFLRDRSPLHRQILALLRQGLTHREIGERLRVSEKMVQRLVRRIRDEEMAP